MKSLVFFKTTTVCVVITLNNLGFKSRYAERITKEMIKRCTITNAIIFESFSKIRNLELNIEKGSII